MHPEHPSDPPTRLRAYDGEQLAYTDEGEGMIVVAIPGLPGAVRDFRWLAPALTDVRLLRVELPGYGQSTRSGFEPMDIAARADAVRFLMDALDIEQAVLLSHSAGGLVAAELAAREPERVRALALIACPGPRPHPVVRATRRFAAPLKTELGRLLMTPLQRVLYAAAGFSSSLSDDERTYTSLDAAAQDFGRHADNLSALTQPTMTARAADDRMIPGRLFEALEHVVPEGPRLRFEQGGHNIQKTMATEIAVAFQRFCA